MDICNYTTYQTANLSAAGMIYIRLWEEELRNTVKYCADVCDFTPPDHLNQAWQVQTTKPLSHSCRGQQKAVARRAERSAAGSPSRFGVLWPRGGTASVVIFQEAKQSYSSSNQQTIIKVLNTVVPLVVVAILYMPSLSWHPSTVQMVLQEFWCKPQHVFQMTTPWNPTVWWGIDTF